MTKYYVVVVPIVLFAFAIGSFLPTSVAAQVGPHSRFEGGIQHAEPRGVKDVTSFLHDIIEEAVISRTNLEAQAEEEKLHKFNKTDVPKPLQDKKNGSDPDSSFSLVTAVFTILICVFAVTLVIRVVYLYYYPEEIKEESPAPYVAFKNAEDLFTSFLYNLPSLHHSK